MEVNILYGSKYILYLGDNGDYKEVVPYDAEKANPPHLGESHGFVHYKDANTGVDLGFCGTYYFMNHSVLLEH